MITIWEMIYIIVGVISGTFIFIAVSRFIVTYNVKLISRAIKMYEEGNYSLALKLYDKVLKSLPREISAWHEKGKTLDKLERYEEALYACEKGIYYLNSSKLGEDYKWFTDLMFAELWINKGMIFNHTGKYEEATECFDKVSKSDPKNLKCFIGKGETLYKLKKYTEAINMYDCGIKVINKDT